MGEYEPRDSRIVTNNPSHTPIEPDRTGPRESETRATSRVRTEKSENTTESSGNSSEKKRWQTDPAEIEERESPGSTGAADGGAGRSSPRPPPGDAK